MEKENPPLNVSNKFNAKKYQNYRELGNKIRSMFVQQSDCDVHFIVGPKKVKMSAHKSVLKFNCKSLSTFLSNIEGNVVYYVSDISHDHFKAMLRFIYNFNITIDRLNVNQLYTIAQRYGVKGLKSCCNDFRRSLVNKDNAIQSLTEAVDNEDFVLVEYCLEIIDKNCNEIITSEEFLKLDSNKLTLILKRDQLIASELDLLKAVIRWAEYRCVRHQIPINGENLFRMTERCLNLIRFPLMSMIEITDCLAKCGLLAFLIKKDYLHDLMKMSVSKRGPKVKFISKNKVSLMF